MMDYLWTIFRVIKLPSAKNIIFSMNLLTTLNQDGFYWTKILSANEKEIMTMVESQMVENI